MNKIRPTVQALARRIDVQTHDIPNATFFVFQLIFQGGIKTLFNNKLLSANARGQDVIIWEIREINFYLGIPVPQSR